MGAQSGGRLTGTLGPGTSHKDTSMSFGSVSRRDRGRVDSLFDLDGAEQALQHTDAFETLLLGEYAQGVGLLPDPAGEYAHESNPDVKVSLARLLAERPSNEDMLADFFEIVGRTAKAKLQPIFKAIIASQATREQTPTTFPRWEENATSHPSVDSGGPVDTLLAVGAAAIRASPEWLVKPSGSPDGAMTVIQDVMSLSTDDAKFRTLLDHSHEGVAALLCKLDIERKTSMASEKGFLLMIVGARRKWSSDMPSGYHDPSKNITTSGYGLPPPNSILRTILYPCQPRLLLLFVVPGQGIFSKCNIATSTSFSKWSCQHMCSGRRAARPYEPR
jgi:hypothetical protein